MREVAIFDFTIDSCGAREGVYDTDGSCVTGTRLVKEGNDGHTHVSASALE